MRFWKIPELDRELEDYLSLILKPVAMRQEFSLDLRERLLTDFSLVEDKRNVWQMLALVSASIFSIFMLIFTGVRAVIFVLSLFGWLRHSSGEIQQKRSAA
jgi:hypothetical protein